MARSLEFHSLVINCNSVLLAIPEGNLRATEVSVQRNTISFYAITVWLRGIGRYRGNLEILYPGTDFLNQW